MVTKRDIDKFYIQMTKIVGAYMKDHNYSESLQHDVLEGLSSFLNNGLIASIYAQIIYEALELYGHKDEDLEVLKHFMDVLRKEKGVECFDFLYGPHTNGPINLKDVNEIFYDSDFVIDLNYNADTPDNIIDDFLQNEQYYDDLMGDEDEQDEYDS
jgi:hypothetical protein